MPAGHSLNVESFFIWKLLMLVILLEKSYSKQQVDQLSIHGKEKGPLTAAEGHDVTPF